ncbi:hypothetical protein BURPS668_2034 [Burkholderia pseudomallei 668]|nr:hypothetical protein BURPS668_2034 [Burkholderia pseudomallei 668]
MPRARSRRPLIRIHGHPGKDYSQYPENTNVFGDSVGGKSRRDTGILDERFILFSENAISYYRASHRGARRFGMTHFFNHLNNKLKER